MYCTWNIYLRLAATMILKKNQLLYSWIFLATKKKYDLKIINSKGMVIPYKQFTLSSLIFTRHFYLQVIFIYQFTAFETAAAFFIPSLCDVLCSSPLRFSVGNPISLLYSILHFISFYPQTYKMCSVDTLIRLSFINDQ